MSRRRPNTAGYTRLNDFDSHERVETDGFVDEQFIQQPKRKFPWKTVLFIISFFIGGLVFLSLGILTSTGYLDKKYEDSSWPLLIVGILMFIPGGYYGYILLCICLKRDGFSMDDVPIF